MTLTADQCGVIAQLLPVFLLAIVIEQRSVIARWRVGRWDRNTLSAPIYTAVAAGFLTNLMGIAVAIVGVANGLDGIWALWLVVTTVGSGTLLGVLTVFVTLVEQSRPDGDQP
ncbi:hypothetical protein [Nocardioides sp. KR10-350]|uniref:hypothetical protein n=1 Tax=Nocardioides cheoyonin TaxID=3156615 RepID=UPI0032B5DAB0